MSWKHVTPADPAASIPDGLGGVLPATGRDVQWTPYWAAHLARGDVVAVDIADPSGSGGSVPGAALTATSTFYVTGEDGLVRPFTLAQLVAALAPLLPAGSGGTSPPPSPTLGTLTLSSLVATAGSAWSATISGRTVGSTLAATSSDGTALTISGTTVSGTFAAAGTPTITVTETLAGATNTPHPTPLVVTVSAASGGSGGSGSTGGTGTADFSNATNSALLAALAA